MAESPHSATLGCCGIPVGLHRSALPETQDAARWNTDSGRRVAGRTFSKRRAEPTPPIPKGPQSGSIQAHNREQRQSVIPFVGSISPDLPWLQLELLGQETGAECSVLSGDGNTGTMLIAHSDPAMC